MPREVHELVRVQPALEKLTAAEAAERSATQARKEAFSAYRAAMQAESQRPELQEAFPVGGWLQEKVEPFNRFSPRFWQVVCVKAGVARLESEERTDYETFYQERETYGGAATLADLALEFNILSDEERLRYGLPHCYEREDKRLRPVDNAPCGCVVYTGSQNRRHYCEKHRDLVRAALIAALGTEPTDDELEEVDLDEEV